MTTLKEHMLRVIESLEQDLLRAEVAELRGTLEYIATHSKDELAVSMAINALSDQNFSDKK